MRCDGCAKWTVRRETLYEDQSRIVNYQAPEGKGHCEILNLDTAPAFGCAEFVDAPGFAHVYVEQKSGAPWQHSRAGPCPDCSGRGSPEGGLGCHRCAGTGKVRHYDDGYVGEERTRLHPKERELGQAAKPKCAACGHEIDREWKACPHCGVKLEAPAEIEKVADPLGGVQQ